MKELILTMILCIYFCVQSIAQEKTIDTIDVVLLGTFHYGVTTDASRTEFSDLFTDKRQQELEELTEQLARLNFDKVFIERQEKYQNKYDSLYSLYLSQKLNDTTVLRPEEIQIGFRLAKKSNLEKVFCVDVKQPLPYEKVKKFENDYSDKEDSPFFRKTIYPFKDNSQKLDLPNQSLSEYYLKMNNDFHKKYRLYDYFHYSMSYQATDDFTGAEFTSVWYERNLKIFSRILNHLTEDDKMIFVLFGSSHTDILEQFFRSNPHFRVIELNQIISK